MAMRSGRQNREALFASQFLVERAQLLKNLVGVFCFCCVHPGGSEADVHQYVVSHLGLRNKAEHHLPRNPSELDLTDLHPGDNLSSQEFPRDG